MHHFDAEQRAAFLSDLKREAPQHSDSIDWLLSRARWSPAWHCQKLFTVAECGKRTLVLDDDVIPDAITPVAATTLRFGAANEREASFYASDETLAQHTLRLQESPLATMLTSLGNLCQRSYLAI